MKKAIGLVVPHSKGEATVTERMMTEWGTASTSYKAKLASGEVVFVHQNLVHAVMNGTYVAEPVKVKGPRKVSTKKERALKHVTLFKRQRMSRGEIIKALSKKLRVSRATAQTYYYAVR